MQAKDYCWTGHQGALLADAFVRTLQQQRPLSCRQREPEKQSQGLPKACKTTLSGAVLRCCAVLSGANQTVFAGICTQPTQLRGLQHGEYLPDKSACGSLSFSFGATSQYLLVHLCFEMRAADKCTWDTAEQTYKVMAPAEL